MLDGMEEKGLLVKRKIYKTCYGVSTKTKLLENQKTIITTFIDKNKTKIDI